ncbi:MAG: PIN domain-containing protein [Acidobacteria bacterium]|nr:MAG: PIN domain-containing protein [Acidobacteriota bacterium]
MADRLYLDVSVLNRPFDDQLQARIKLETEAFLAILERIEAGEFAMVGSSVLDFENGANPFAERKERVESYLKLASQFVKVDEVVKERAETIATFGFKSFDALHLACAEMAAETFLTVDDKVIKRATDRAGELDLKVLNPIDFVRTEIRK